MKTVGLEQWHWQQLAEPMLPYCLAISEADEQDVAALVTKDGVLVVSPSAWHYRALELNNICVLMERSGAHIKAQLCSPAHEIRKLLHDAVASQEVQRRSLVTEQQRSRAHQALEDLVQQALVYAASDIHLLFEPQQATVAFRVHGALVQRTERPRELMSAAIAAALNTRSDDFHELYSEQSLSSASIRLTVIVRERPLALRLRVQKSPTRLGFAVTMRIQNEQAEVLTLAQLGFEPAVCRAVASWLQQKSGLILVIGATGQGKTTTLAGLNLQLSSAQKAISLEDPIEIVQPQIEQKPVLAEHPELNFANMVKVALREDPDLISISEIRDEKTAQAAYSAALTGHIVTATLHAHDCAGAAQRLLDLGLSAANLAQPGVLRGIIAQRLVSIRCPHCLGNNPVCDHCHGVGASGRRLVYEWIDCDQAFAQAFREGQLARYFQQLVEQGWQSIETQLKASEANHEATE
ncbi:GspE/PulE family protein [Pseudidiomarina taiwanensis]|uniref:Bacterial type II secretion system protein E domain-containing protein n=1 Tax=Pseudidiomarina taiwanensis TaxID=337250 RepID=A0A432ZKA3_9GAMM|nr:ATPase, T2SS/T4P/T4SS family [Pseudidiomarina taiwanensis]RUO78260.1 hypothetical protein CWI83_04300 [Pseudidiomarina taiwanensis]